MEKTKKKSLYFLDFDTLEAQESITALESTSLADLSVGLFSCFDCVSAFTEYITQRNRTNELNKQINAKMHALDVRLGEYKEQTSISLREYSIQINEKIKAQKDILKFEIQKELAECEQKSREHKLQFKQYMIQNIAARKTLETIGEQLQDIRKMLDVTKKEGADSNKYYIMLSEQYRLTWKNYTNIAKVIAQ